MGVRGHTSFPFEGFGKGLNLADKPDTVDPAECIDAMDVLFTDRGAITQRSGYGKLTEAKLTNRVASLEPFYTSAGTKQLMAGCGTRLEALSTAGKVVDSETELTGAVWDFARFGKPNGEVAYAGNGTDTLRKWNGTEWTAPKATVDGEAEKAMPKAGSLCVWAAGGNRLIATRFSTTTGGPNGATSSPDHVYFSEPGDPEEWKTTAPNENLVKLFPGNGEPIMAAVAWREFVFVFKETCFFVFYGASVDGEGSAVFNFRPVEAGVGLVSPRAVCVAPEGVYFMSRDGVYRTTGQEPELVSSPIEPIWTGEASVFYTGGFLLHSALANCAMTWFQGRVYLSYTTSSANNRTLVYDPQLRWWSLTSLAASCLAVFRPSNAEELVFGYAAGDNHIARHSSSYTSDDGAAIESHWRSGWFDLGNPDVKVLRSSKFWGTGKAFCGMGHDFNEATGTLDLLDMEGGSETEWDESEWGEGEWAKTPGLLSAHKRRSTRGTVFSLYFANTTKDQSFSVHRAVHHLREVAKPERSKA